MIQSMRRVFSDNRQPCQSRQAGGFTLIELLVVIAIVAILAAILFPVITNARENAWQSQCVSNLKQLGSAVRMYVDDCGAFPMLSCAATVTPKSRWADHIFRYVKNDKLFSCRKVLGRAGYMKSFAHAAGVMYGGYGYNFQYLGNSREGADYPKLPFTATDNEIITPSRTFAIADTDGALNMDGTASGQGVTALDPPIPSERGSGVPSGYYAADTYANGGRAIPAERHNGRVSVVFADGHAKSMTRKDMDDSNNDGVVDNGYYNGRYNPSLL